MDTFQTPDFLSDQDVESIHQEMMNELPDDIDKSEGQFAWDFTRPTALEKASFSQFQLAEAVKLIFPQFAYGQWLDYHAENRGITRKSGTSATGTLTITGTAGQTIPAGSLFSTTSINGAAAVTFATTGDATIGEGGTVDASIAATDTGMVGNVSANTITIKASALTYVTSCTNAAATTGGTEQEDDETLRVRIVEYDRSQGVSFVGSASDYKRWAESVDGTGTATIIPAQDTSGLVTIVLTDSTGQPASEDLRTAVYNHIMRPDDEYARLAPVNASLSVVAPTSVTISVSATVELNSGFTLEDAGEELLKAIQIYFAERASQEGVVRYSEIACCLIELTSTIDYTDLLLNEGTSNISLSSTETPSITAENITLTSGTI